MDPELVFVAHASDRYGQPEPVGRRHGRAEALPLVVIVLTEGW